MIEWKPNEPEVGPEAANGAAPAADFITISEEPSHIEMLANAIAIKARLDERAEGRSNGR